MDRRTFFAGAATAVSSVAMAALPEPVIATKPDTAPPLVPNTGRPYNPVVTLNGWTLPWRMNNGVKEFHLVAEPVVREMAPGFKVNMWGYNGQSPGLTIEVVEGDRGRVFVSNKRPELTTVHQPVEEKGYLAAEVLVAALARDAAVRHYLLPCELMVRQSVATLV